MTPYPQLDPEELKHRQQEYELWWQEQKRLRQEEARQKRATGEKVAIVVNDSFSSSMLLQRILEVLGLFVIDVPTGAEAIEMAMADVYDLIVIWDREFWGCDEPEPKKTLDETLEWMEGVHTRYPDLPPILWLLKQTPTDQQQARLQAVDITTMYPPVDIDDYERVAQELLGS